MTPQQILQILGAMTEPQAAGRATRLDYCNAQLALNALAEIFAALSAPPAPPPAPPPPVDAPAEPVTPTDA